MTPLELLNSRPSSAARLAVRQVPPESRERPRRRDHVVREDLCPMKNIIHGGAIIALADTVSARLDRHNLPEGAAPRRASARPIPSARPRPAPPAGTATPSTGPRTQVGNASRDDAGSWYRRHPTQMVL